MNCCKNFRLVTSVNGQHGDVVLTTEGVTEEYLDERLSEYYDKDEVDEKIAGHVTEEYLDEKLSDYYDKDEVDEKLEHIQREMQYYTEDENGAKIEVGTLGGHTSSIQVSQYRLYMDHTGTESSQNGSIQITPAGINLQHEGPSDNLATNVEIAEGKITINGKEVVPFVDYDAPKIEWKDFYKVSTTPKTTGWVRVAQTTGPGEVAGLGGVGFTMRDGNNIYQLFFRENNETKEILYRYFNLMSETLQNVEFITLSKTYTGTGGVSVSDAGVISVDAYTKEEADDKLDAKQDTLVSGTNIKTVNGESLLGEGNIEIQGGGELDPTKDYDWTGNNNFDHFKTKVDGNKEYHDLNEILFGSDDESIVKTKFNTDDIFQIMAASKYEFDEDANRINYVWTGEYTDLAIKLNIEDKYRQNDRIVLPESFEIVGYETVALEHILGVPSDLSQVWFIYVNYNSSKFTNNFNIVSEVTKNDIPDYFNLTYKPADVPDNYKVYKFNLNSFYYSNDSYKHIRELYFKNIIDEDTQNYKVFPVYIFKPTYPEVEAASNYNIKFNNIAIYDDNKKDTKTQENQIIEITGVYTYPDSTDGSFYVCLPDYINGDFGFSTNYIDGNTEYFLKFYLSRKIYFEKHSYITKPLLDIPDVTKQINIWYDNQIFLGPVSFDNKVSSNINYIDFNSEYWWNNNTYYERASITGLQFTDNGDSISTPFVGTTLMYKDESEIDPDEYIRNGLYAYKNESHLGAFKYKLNSTNEIEPINIITMTEDAALLNGEQIATENYVDDKIKDIELVKTPNLTLFGNPTINLGQISGFTSTNYAQFPFLVNLNSPFTLNICLTTPSGVSSLAQQNIFDSEFGLALAIRDNKLVWAASSNGTGWNLGEHVGTTTLASETTYYIQFSWSGDGYKMEISTDGVNYDLDSDLESSESLYPKKIVIGKSLTGNYFTGSINLNHCSLNIGGVEYWQGMDDVGLATRLATDLSNIDADGENKITEITGIKFDKGYFDPVDVTADGQAHEITAEQWDYLKSIVNEETPKVYIRGYWTGGGGAKYHSNQVYELSYSNTDQGWGELIYCTSFDVYGNETISMYQYYRGSYVGVKNQYNNLYNLDKDLTNISTQGENKIKEIAGGGASLKFITETDADDAQNVTINVGDTDKPGSFNVSSKTIIGDELFNETFSSSLSLVDGFTFTGEHSMNILDSTNKETVNIHTEFSDFIIESSIKSSSLGDGFSAKFIFNQDGNIACLKNGEPSGDHFTKSAEVNELIDAKIGNIEVALAAILG